MDRLGKGKWLRMYLEKKQFFTLRSSAILPHPPYRGEKKGEENGRASFVKKESKLISFFSEVKTSTLLVTILWLCRLQVSAHDALKAFQWVLGNYITEVRDARGWCEASEDPKYVPHEHALKIFLIDFFEKGFKQSDFRDWPARNKPNPYFVLWQRMLCRTDWLAATSIQCSAFHDFCVKTKIGEWENFYVKRVSSEQIERFAKHWTPRIHHQ